MPKERIQKILAAAGFGSRRACETLVTDGHVEIDGRVASELPIVVDPAECRITVDGRPVRGERHVYYMLNKPKGYFCTNNDPDGRRRAIDLMVGVRERVFPVGRLDAETMGLLLITNDGALAQKLTHPRFQTPKTYRAEVRGVPEFEKLEKLRNGVWMAGGRTGPAEIVVIHSSRQKSILEITLREGRNREIRRMLAKLGHPVNRLTRIKVGRLNIKRVPLGGFRPLTEAEVKYLNRLAEGIDEALTTTRDGRTAKKTTQSGGTGRHASKTGTTRKKPTRGGAPVRGRSDHTRNDGKRTDHRSTGAKPAARGAPVRQDKETALPPGGGKKKRRVILPE
jgi:23S rRNA pseudouridine2605 synthase